jgi:hypothetical protein
LVSKIPVLVSNPHGNHVLCRKWNFLVPADLYDTALAYDHLLKYSFILEPHRNNLITESGFFLAFEMFRARTRKGCQPFHHSLQPSELAGSGILRYGDGVVYHREGEEEVHPIKRASGFSEPAICRHLRNEVVSTTTDPSPQYEGTWFFRARS